MKKHFLASLISVTFLASSTVLANEDHAAKAWTIEAWDQAVAEKPQGDIARGKKLHSYGLCITCHGENGVAPSRNAPNLAASTELYTYKQLMDYHSALRNEGDGKAEVMHAATIPMSKQDMADLAAFYAAQKLPAPKEQYTAPANIIKLVRHGDMTNRMITACASCHGVHGEGRGFTPALAGQKASYFIRTMLNYKQGKRTNDIDEGMSQFAKDLSDDEIKALAEYYAHLTPKNPAGKE